MRLRSFVLFALTLLSLSVDAASRRRAIAKGPGFDDSTPAGWLAANAYVLTTTDLVPYTGDLQGLKHMIGLSDVVGLGDGTHGTHEFYTVKLRVIDMMVREMGFDVVAFEGPFPLMNRLDTYVQTGVGNPRALTHELQSLYFFWDTEEMIAVIEWMREYNANRGDRPAVHIAGFDVFEPWTASREVIAYLHSVDPAGSLGVAKQYKCIAEDTVFINELPCRIAALAVRDGLAAREAELTAVSSADEFQEALQYARVVAQSYTPVGPSRDDAMATNALWLRDHRGSTGRIVLWAHDAHVSKTRHQWLGEETMGHMIRNQIGSDYFALGTLTATGSFLRWDFSRKVTLKDRFPALEASSLESLLRQSGQSLLLIPLNGTLPTWLSAAHPQNSAGTTGWSPLSGSLALQYDAAIFVDTTTATKPTTLP
jgi:erythromycin esterase